MDSLAQTVKTGAEQFGIRLTDKQLEQFERYASLLIEWNEKMNLTAITDLQEIAVKHFIDSLSMLHYISLPQHASVIDVGTGAGFPGIPLLIARPDLKLTLLDSLNKRLIFLNELLDNLALTANIVHARAEEAGQNRKYREQYDAAVSRAVAPMNTLSEYCLPLVKEAGVFVAMKGPQGVGELEAAQNAINLLGGGVKTAKTFRLPDGSTRSMLIIKKERQTEKKYPRHGSKISKMPLE